MYGDKSIYCVLCKKDRWVGARCSSSKDGVCVDKLLYKVKKDLKREKNEVVVLSQVGG